MIIALIWIRIYGGGAFEAAPLPPRLRNSKKAQAANRVNSSFLVYSFIVKTIQIFNATKIPCGEQRKLEPFSGFCFVAS